MTTKRPFLFIVASFWLGLIPIARASGDYASHARPPGFQRTLAYLEGELYNYNQPQLQSARNSILHEDLVTTVIPQLKQTGQPPSSWPGLATQTIQQYEAQDSALRNIIRQTFTDPESIITAVDERRPLADELLQKPEVLGLILLKWQLMNVTEQAYQIGLYVNGDTGSAGGKSPPTGMPNPNPPKGGKNNNQLDYERMRRDRQAAIDRRKAIEAKRAHEAAERWAELNELFRILIGNQTQSPNKFKQAQVGSAVTVPQLGEIGPPEPVAEPTKEPSKPEDPGQEPDQGTPAKPEAPPKAKLVKINIYHGTFTFTRHPSLSDDQWTKIKADMIKDMGLTPGISDLNDAGDVLTWQYKGKVPGDKLLATAPPLFTYTAGETTEEEVADDGSIPAPAAPKKKSFEGNGPLTEEDLKGKDVPGSGPQFAPPKPDKFSTKREPKPEPAKPEPAKATPGYWYDPNDNEAKGPDPIIYVRVDGEAVRVHLSEAKGYGVPGTATKDTMTWYSERDGHIVKGKDRGTQKGSDN